MRFDSLRVAAVHYLHSRQIATGHICLLHHQKSNENLLSHTDLARLGIKSLDKLAGLTER